MPNRQNTIENNVLFMSIKFKIKLRYKGTKKTLHSNNYAVENNFHNTLIINNRNGFLVDFSKIKQLNS